MRITRSLVSRAALGATMLAGIAAVTAATDTTHGAAMFGGPWISIESPANPYDPTARGALMLVHTFHHGTKADLPVVGKAEGLVDGERKTVSLTLAKSSEIGTHSVRNEWGSKGTWTVLVTASQGDTQIQAVAEINSDGSVGKISVPSKNGRPHLLSVAEIDRGLRERTSARVARAANQ
jgi:hypothetical protein